MNDNTSYLSEIPSYLSGDGIYTLIFLHPFAWLCFIFSKLFSNVRTDVAPAFLRREQLEFETVLSTSRSGTYTYKIHQKMKTFQTWTNKGMIIANNKTNNSCLESLC